MISIIICSINTALASQLQKNIADTIGVQYELIIVDNSVKKHSLAQAYNEGASQARYNFLCFVHEDILFHTKNWGHNLISHLSDPGVSLIGILGTTIKTRTPSGVYIPIEKLNRVSQLQRAKDGDLKLYYTNPGETIRSEVIILDGMFLAVTKYNHNKYPFDDKILKGFHGYDIDYSLGQAVNGRIIVVYDILLEHLSSGGNTKAWIDSQLLVTKKWRYALPVHINLTKSEIRASEIVNLETMLTSLYNNNYKKAAQFKYLARLLVMRPFSRKNFYFLRKFFLFGRLESGFKKMHVTLSGRNNLFII